jgi:NADH:ubiquinone oxidoreductase subunit 6 (subunit J)
MSELIPHIPIPTLQQVIFISLAIFVAASALWAVLARNLFHSALGLVATLFGVAGIYFLLEAEFVGVSQILVYVGAIATLITFAIMLTRGMMFGSTAQLNRQALAGGLIAILFFLVILGVVFQIPWPDVAAEITDGEALIANLGMAFVTTYLVPFELLALLLLVALTGALLLARDR